MKLPIKGIHTSYAKLFTIRQVHCNTYLGRDLLERPDGLDDEG
jgi:hypothetical protein